MKICSRSTIYATNAYSLMRYIASVLLLVPCVALAEPAVPQGVWSGTIGSSAVTVCFNAAPYYASYYYNDIREPIGISRHEADWLWHESSIPSTTGMWALSKPVHGQLAGTWRDPKTQTSLPIHLRFVDGDNDERACARDTYNLRLETPPKVEIGKYVQLSPDRSYRKLRFAGQETIELTGPDLAIRKINAILKLDRSKEAINAYFQQKREFLGRMGSPTVDLRTTDPTFWDSNFITVRFNAWVAGEGRSGISNTYRTWNLKTGEEVNVWHWLGVRSDDAALPSALQQHLYRHVKESSECKVNYYRGKGVFTLVLTKAGLNIYEDAWGSGCDKHFFVSYKNLMPFLSPAGKQAVRSILNGRVAFSAQ